jgi:prophage regulatory protein
MQSRLIRSKEVQAITGLPKSSLHNMARAGSFPAPLKLGARAVAWREADVQAWVENLEAKEVR